MNFKSRLHKKLIKLTNIQKQLELDQDDADDFNPEIGADLRWATIMLERVILGIRKARE